MAGKVSELVEVFPVQLAVDESRSDRVLIRGPFGHCEKPTSNGRIYGRKLMEREFGKLSEAMASRNLFGELDHPDDGRTSLKRVSHIITNLRIEKDGEVVGELEPLPTPMGQILKALAKAGCTLGVSSRGRGSVVTRDDGVDEVQDDFVLKTYDVVDNPASKNAFPSVVSESEVSAFLEGIDEGHREEVRAAFTEAAEKLDTFTLADIKDDALRARVQEALGSPGTVESADDERFIEALAKKIDGVTTGVVSNVFYIEGTKFAVHGEWVEIYLNKSRLPVSVWIMQPDDEKRADIFAKWYKSGMDFKSKVFARVKDYEEASAADEADESQPTGFVVYNRWADSPGAINGYHAGLKGGGFSVLRKVQDLKVWKTRRGAEAAAKEWSGTKVAEYSEFMAMLEESRAEEVNTLKQELASGLKDLQQKLRTEIEADVRASLLSDPQVAGARMVMESIIELVRPLGVLGVHADDRLRRENIALKDALKARDFALAESRMEAATLVNSANAKLMEAHFTTRVAGHPKAKSIARMIGPLSALAGVDDLNSRLEAAFEAMGPPEKVAQDLAAAYDQKTEAVSAEFEAKILRLNRKIDDLKSKLDARTSSLKEAVALGEELDAARLKAEAQESETRLRLYAAQKLLGRSDGVALMSECEAVFSKKGATTGDVDRVIRSSSHLEESTRDRVRRSFGSTEHPGTGQTPRRGGKLTTEGSKFGVDLHEAAALAGVSGTT
jgi:hypothetical protein